MTETLAPAAEPQALSLVRRIVRRLLRRAAVPAALLIVVGVILSPVMRTGLWFQSHENARYPLLFDEFRRAFLAGNLYPRWLPDLYGGYGYPTFCYYQPAFFFTSLAFSWLPGYPVSATYGALWLLLFLGAYGAYHLGAELGDRLAGLFCAVLFLVTPYLWVNLYVRGDMSELTAMLLAPWSIYFLLVVARRTRARQPVAAAALGLGLATAAVIYGHPITALFVLPSLGLIALWMAFAPDLRARFILHLALAGLICLAASAPYWQPLLALRHEAGLERAGLGYYAAALHVVYFPQLVWRVWGFGGSGRLYRDGMSFQLGAVHLALATAGLIVARRQRLLQASYAIYLGLIVLMTPVALRLWSDVDLFRTMQFPWRILSAISIVQITCIAGLAGALARPGISRRRALLAYAGILVVTLAWQSSQFVVQAPLDVRKQLDARNQAGRLSTMQNYAGVDEFLPRTAKAPRTLRPRGTTIPIVEAAAPATATPLPGSTAYAIRYRVAAAAPVEATVNQLYFPGWRVAVDDRPVAPETLLGKLRPDGRMVVALPAGEHTLSARYAGPPGFASRLALAALAAMALALFWLGERRRRAR